MEAWKLVPGAEGSLTTNADLINIGFPVMWSKCDFNKKKGRERLKVYHQSLVGVFQAAMRWPTSLFKISKVCQGLEETPGTFQDRLIETYKTYTSLEPKVPESWSAVSLTFANQSVPHIHHKLQNLNGFESKKLAELIEVLKKCSITERPQKIDRLRGSKKL